MKTIIHVVCSRVTSYDLVSFHLAIYSVISSYLTYIDVGQESVWTASSKSSAVQIWDIDDGSPKGMLRCDEFVNDL